MLQVVELLQLQRGCEAPIPLLNFMWFKLNDILRTKCNTESAPKSDVDECITEHVVRLIYIWGVKNRKICLFIRLGCLSPAHQLLLNRQGHIATTTPIKNFSLIACLRLHSKYVLTYATAENCFTFRTVCGTCNSLFHLEAFYVDTCTENNCFAAQEPFSCSPVYSMLR